MNDRGEIQFDRELSGEFAELRESFDHFFHATSYVEEDELEAREYAAMLESAGIAFRAYEAGKGTRFRFSSEDADLAARAYAEVLSQRLNREQGESQ